MRFTLPTNGQVGVDGPLRGSRPIIPFSDTRLGIAGENQPLRAPTLLLYIFLVYKYTSGVLAQIPSHPGA